jgi:hypothetical protein
MMQHLYYILQNNAIAIILEFNFLINLNPGFPGWIAPAGPKAAETLTKLPIPYFYPLGPSEFGYLIQRKSLI